MYENWQFAQLFVQSIIYIYIYILSRGCTKFLQNYLKTATDGEIRGKFFKIQSETEKITRFLLDFKENSLDFACISVISFVFNEKRGKHGDLPLISRNSPPFPPFPSVFSVFGQREGKSPEKTGRGQSIHENPKTIPPAAWATGSGGRATGFRRPAADSAQDSPRKNFAGEFLSSCSARLVWILLDCLKNVAKIFKNPHYCVKFTQKYFYGIIIIESEREVKTLETFLKYDEKEKYQW